MAIKTGILQNQKIYQLSARTRFLLVSHSSLLIPHHTASNVPKLAETGIQQESPDVAFNRNFFDSLST